MKHVSLHGLWLTIVLATGVMANPDGDIIGGAKVKRDVTKIAEVLRKPLALGAIADAFHEALHTEEVARDPDAAAAMYATILKEFRAQEGDRGAGGAALALFRLAEIRRRQGRNDDARTHYAELTEEFADWEPMATLARQQLGLAPSDVLPEVTKIEQKRPLSEHVERSVWKIRTRVCDDKFVLVTFKVDPDEGSQVGGLPEPSVVETLHYRPGGPLAGFVTDTRVEGDALQTATSLGKAKHKTLITRITGFGHAYDVPAGLRQNSVATFVMSDSISSQTSPHDVKALWAFENDRGEDPSALSVELTLTTLSEARARELAESRAVGILPTADQAWSITLPPAPASSAKPGARD